MAPSQSLAALAVCATFNCAANSASVGAFCWAETEMTRTKTAARRTNRRAPELPMVLLRVELRCGLAGSCGERAGATAQAVELGARPDRVARALGGHRQVPRDFRCERA